MTNVAHGQVIDDILHKRGTQVVKYWKYNGYAVPILQILKVKGVKLYTKYDGVIYASKQTFDRHAIPHMFGDEHQLVLPIQFWEQVNKQEEIV